MSKVTRDGIRPGLATDLNRDGSRDGMSDRMPPRAHEPATVAPAAAPPAETPAPRKRLDLNATITLSEEALAALLEEVKSGRGANLDDADPIAPVASPEPPSVPQPWIRFEGTARRKL
jgi:hypothetical protein